MDELPPDARAVLERLLPRVRAERVKTEFLPGGYSNRNYRLRVGRKDLVLRVVDPTHAMPGVDRVREHAIVTGPARALGPALEAFAFPEGHMLTRFVPGQRLDAVRPRLESLARYVARVHSTLGTLPATYALDEVLLRFVAAARAHGSPIPTAVGRALERFRWRADLLVPCHNDLNPWNVIVTGDDPLQWVTLDWEIAGMGDPWFDVIVLTEGAALAEPDERIVIDTYAAESGRRRPDPSEWAMLRRAFLLREHLWAHLQWALGNRRCEIGEQRDNTLARLTTLD